MKQVFPKMIKNLPEADIQFERIQGWISQSENHQMVFLEIEPIARLLNTLMELNGASLVMQKIKDTCPKLYYIGCSGMKVKSVK